MTESAREPVDGQPQRGRAGTGSSGGGSGGSSSNHVVEQADARSRDRSGEPSGTTSNGLLRRLVDDYYARVYRFAFRLSGTASDADDVTQQTFLQAQRKLDQLEDVDRARSWLFAIARNVYLKGLRRPATRDTVSLESVGEPGREDESAEAVFDTEELQRALDQLPEDYRAVVVLFYFRELSYKEIAESLEIPMGTVMSRLSRAKRDLRRELGADDGLEGESGEPAE